MTDREKTETLAKWTGYNVGQWCEHRGLYVSTRIPVDTPPEAAGSLLTCRWWHPLHNIANAMEIYERLVMLGKFPCLVSFSIDGSPTHRLDFGETDGPDCSTIPAAICEAMVEWLEEKGE